ncbi:MAG: hypothetical protein Q4F57_09270 [Weeksellaceae bacterium]|nr:hypothetical protein [Weeksellaceae bacterium]
MMDFWQRFKFFFLGSLMGIFFVILVFGKRMSCKQAVIEYLPNGRVLAEIRYKDLQVSPEARISFDTLAIDSSFLYDNILMKGDVDFANSEPRRQPCGKYLIHFTKNSLDYEMYVTKCREISRIDSLSQSLVR